MLGRRRKALGPVPLGDAVRAAAARPSARHHESLVAALAAADELILRVIDEAGPGSSDRDPGAEVQVATAVSPNGSSFLHVLTDRDEAQARWPEARLVGVAPEAAFRMALANGNVGLLVSTGGDDDTWAAVTAEGVARLLDGL